MPLRCFAPCNTLRATTWPRGNVLVSEDGGVFSDDALHVGGGGGEAFLETVVLWDGVYTYTHNLRPRNQDWWRLIADWRPRPQIWHNVLRGVLEAG
jgi:hypothetical protein